MTTLKAAAIVTPKERRVQDCLRQRESLEYLNYARRSTRQTQNGATVKRKRKTEINLEIKEAVAIRTRRVVVAHCRQCDRQSRMVAPNEAAMIARLRTREVYRLVELGELHFIEDQNGLLFICLNSLNADRF